MSLTRRKLFGWVAALFGGAAVAKVAREEPFSLNDAVASVQRNSQLPSHHPYAVIDSSIWPMVGDSARYIGAGRAGYLTPGKVYEIDAVSETSPGMLTVGLRCADDGIQSHWIGLRYFEPTSVRVAGYVPPDEYVHGVTPGWTFRKYEGDA